MFIPLRDDGRRRRFPTATFTLVLVNCLVFLVQQAVPVDWNLALLYHAGAVPRAIAEGGIVSSMERGSPATILSAMFLHGGLEHLLGNVWFLWIFGDDVEDAMGPWRFVAFYLLTGFLAIAFQVAMTPSSKIPVVGASGAIAGILGAYFALYPQSSVEVLLFLLVIVEIVIVPAFVVLGVWLVWQLLANSGDGSVAVWAHVAGFLLGALACRLFAARGRRHEPRPRWGAAWSLPTVASASSSSLP